MNTLAAQPPVALQGAMPFRALTLEHDKSSREDVSNPQGAFLPLRGGEGRGEGER